MAAHERRDFNEALEPFPVVYISPTAAAACLISRTARSSPHWSDRASGCDGVHPCLLQNMAALELTYKRPKCLPKTRRGGSRRTLRSCRSCCGSLPNGIRAVTKCLSGNFRGLLTIAEFEKRQQAEEGLRARERFDLLKKSGWQCEVRAGDKEPGVDFTVYREVKPGSAAQRPFITYQPEKQRDTVLVNVATKGSAAPLGSFGLDQITEDFVQTEATKFFAHVASEIG